MLPLRELRYDQDGNELRWNVPTSCGGMCSIATSSVPTENSAPFIVRTT